MVPTRALPRAILTKQNVSRTQGGDEEEKRGEKWRITEITALRQRQQEAVIASPLDEVRALFLFRQFAREKFLYSA